MEVANGVKEISRGVLRSIVACAEQNDDRLRSICIETLAELCMILINPIWDGDMLMIYIFE